jgi:hypothetical protein
MKNLVKALILTTTLMLSIMGCSSGSSSKNSSGSGSEKKTVINALFMKQAGYSVDDVTNMTNEFMKIWDPKFLHRQNPAVMTLYLAIAYGLHNLHGQGSFST